MKSDTKNHRRGPGAAHIGFAMFGARGPLLAPEDGGNGAGGSGGETTSSSTTTTTAGSPGTAPAGAGGDKLFTQEQVNALVAQARREGRESALRQQPTTQQPTTQQQQKPAAPANGEAQPMTAEQVQQLMARERAFTRATATAQLNEKQLARMEAAFRADSPSDVAAWSTAYLEDMGLVKPSTQQQNPNGSTPGTNGAPQSPPATAPTVPSRVDPMTSGGLVDIWNLSADQIEQLGPEGIRAEHEKILAQANKRSGAPPIPRVMQRK